ncbi:hypothetical protein CVS30_06440 [Arthrobacter psychrolactophilus]|uniref:Asp23/Gls24 family protein n=1 Tax=Arthrobacter psychrolactophilus TaxID=92442 RepID=A0A2V5IQY1_9MICC|nr:hypothetical protein [Arthrobacter psychrolactophilus]PYI38949.1 hypothetical protein CVS30_06440 [Arthrobacter psychrolactophilus]
MSLEEQIHQRVLGLDGVGTVYLADPVWLTAVKQLGTLIASGESKAPAPFVVCVEEESEGRSLLTVKVRIGTDGSVPAPAIARSVASEIRSLVGEAHPHKEVKAIVELAALGV